MLIESKDWKKLTSRLVLKKNHNKLIKIKKAIYKDYGDFSFLNYHNNNEIFNNLKKAKNKFKDVDKILLIGTGGSSFGAKALTSILNKKKLYYLENIDPFTIKEFFENNKNNKLGLLIISKSGETLEVLSLFDIITKVLKKNIDLKKKSLIICDKNKSTLRKIAEKHNIEVFDHDERIGGRFSCFSITGLLPLHLSGVNAIKLKYLVDVIFKQHLLNYNFNYNSSIISLASILKKKKYVSHVFLIYIDRFKNIGQWYKQLWTESLGKDGVGLHLVSALGAVDQHSQLQMWLDGPKNLIFTVVIPKKRSFDYKLNNTKNILPYYLKGKDIGKLLNIMAEATIIQLRKVGIPVRVIYLEDDEIVSAIKLMANLLLEVPLLGSLIDINAFSQPAVEKMKLRTKTILKKNV